MNTLTATQSRRLTATHVVAGRGKSVHAVAWAAVDGQDVEIATLCGAGCWEAADYLSPVEGASTTCRSCLRAAAARGLDAMDADALAAARDARGAALDASVQRMNEAAQAAQEAPAAVEADEVVEAAPEAQEADEVVEDVPAVQAAPEWGTRARVGQGAAVHGVRFAGSIFGNAPRVTLWCGAGGRAQHKVRPVDAAEAVSCRACLRAEAAWEAEARGAREAREAQEAAQETQETQEAAQAAQEAPAAVEADEVVEAAPEAQEDALRAELDATELEDRLAQVGARREGRPVADEVEARRRHRLYMDSRPETFTQGHAAYCADYGHAEAVPAAAASDVAPHDVCGRCGAVLPEGAEARGEVRPVQVLVDETVVGYVLELVSASLVTRTAAGVTWTQDGDPAPTAHRNLPGATLEDALAAAVAWWYEATGQDHAHVLPVGGGSYIVRR